MTDSPRGTGFIPDPPGHCWTHFRSGHPGAYKALPLGIPDSAGPRDFAAPVSDQDGAGECVSHGILDTIYCVLGSKGRPLPAVLSHRAGYAIGRSIDRANYTPLGRPLPVLDDIGCQPNQLVRALAVYGCALSTEMDGGTLDAVPAKINDELLLGEWEACARRRLPVDWVTVGDGDADKIDQLVQALATGYPFALAIEADGEFQRYDGTGILDTQGGALNHMIHCHYYRTNAAHRREFLVQNSWSRQWGLGGLAWTSEEFMRAAGNILIPRVTT